MKHRFFIPHLLATGATVALEGDELHHARVLRLRDGEEVEVFDGRGGAWIAAARELPSIELLRAVDVDREPRVALHLALAIINLDKFELVLQKATELGARSIIPLVTERIEVRAERYRGKDERWQKIVFEAVKQSGRARVPVVESPAAFDDVVRRGFQARSESLRGRGHFDADAPPTQLERRMGEVGIAGARTTPSNRISTESLLPSPSRTIPSAPLV